MNNHRAPQGMEPQTVLKKTVRVLREMYHQKRHNFTFKATDICYKVSCSRWSLADKLERLVELEIVRVKLKNDRVTIYETAFNYKPRNRHW